MGWYLHGIADQADARGYRYDRARVDRGPSQVSLIAVTAGQLDLEWWWLRTKLTARSPAHLDRWADVVRPEQHRSFELIDGPVASWSDSLLRGLDGGVVVEGLAGEERLLLGAAREQEHHRQAEQDRAHAEEEDAADLPAEPGTVQAPT